MKCNILLFKSQVLWVESGPWITPASAYFAYFQCLSCSLCHILFVVLVGSPCSCERTLTWGWTSSWMMNSACTMWQHCLKSSWGTCLILFYPGNCTLPSCTPTVRICTEPYLLKVFVSVSRHLIVTPHQILNQNLILVSSVLRGAEQLQYLQHLLYLLPPCNCDTLLRLLSMLQTVQSFAQDSIGTNDEEVGPVSTLQHCSYIFDFRELDKNVFIYL